MNLFKTIPALALFLVATLCNAQITAINLAIEDIQIDGGTGSFVIHGIPEYGDETVDPMVGAYYFNMLFQSFEGFEQMEVDVTNLIPGMIDAGLALGSDAFPATITQGRITIYGAFANEGIVTLPVEGAPFARVDISSPAGIDIGDHFFLGILANDPSDPVFRVSLIDTYPLGLVSRQIGNGGPCDVNQDGLCTAADIDLLSDIVRSGEQDLQFDLNGDNSVDGADRDFWIVDLMNTYVGDSDLDGVFGTRDLIAIFTAGQYEDEIVGNSTWATGDWNGDGDFGTPDLIAAFGQAGFEVGPRAAASVVPEPATCFSLLIGMLLVVHRQRGF